MNIPDLKRWQRTMALMVIYFAVLVTAAWLAHGLRFDFVVPMENQIQVKKIWMWVWGIKLLALALAGQYSSLLSFFSLPDLRRLGIAVCIVTGGLLCWWFLSAEVYGLSRGVVIIDGILSFLGLALCRLGFRLIREGRGGKSSSRRVGIVGAGEVGAALVRDLQTKKTLEPIVIFDDSAQKKGTQIHGIRVIGPVETLREGDEVKLNEVIIAMPSAPGERIREVVELMDELEILCRTVPAMSQIAAGDIITNLRPIEIGDILGREPVDLELEDLQHFYAKKIVMVTGAGGSIGSELCRQLAGMDLERLVLVERSELQLFEIESELKDKVEVSPELADVQDKENMSFLLAQHNPSILFHAAAYKHVTLTELQPAVAIRNNILMTHQLAHLAAKYGVHHFVLISTDKAVEPSSVMGATKLLAERVMEGHAFNDPDTHFITVRFGNVLGSSGSVVPIFKRQIAHGGPVTVRGESSTRFFMSIPEAAGLVLRSAEIGENGDRFILNMGEPVRITELAKEMIRLSGKTLGEDIKIHFVDLLPGEKIHEKLNSSAETIVDTSQAKIQRIKGAALSIEEWSRLESALNKFEGKITAAVDESQLQLPGDFTKTKKAGDEAARDWLRRVLPEYRSE